MIFLYFTNVEPEAKVGECLKEFARSCKNGRVPELELDYETIKSELTGEEGDTNK